MFYELYNQLQLFFLKIFCYQMLSILKISNLPQSRLVDNADRNRHFLVPQWLLLMSSIQGCTNSIPVPRKIVGKVYIQSQIINRKVDNYNCSFCPFFHSLKIQRMLYRQPVQFITTLKVSCQLYSIWVIEQGHKSRNYQAQ